MEKFQIFKTHAIFFRKLLGVIILAAVVYMVYGEGVSVASVQSDPTLSRELQNGIPSPYLAPEIDGINDWINSEPLTMNQLKGKVVLIDFWTYSCINCIRTLPYVKAWYEKYHNKGLVIIGVHTPEFEFEKNSDNVKRAVEKFGIHYPVALDNQFSTWRNFNNQYWPAHYLIDKNGNVVYQHFGEGEYDVTENNIRYLLGETGGRAVMSDVSQQDFSLSQTPETYLGYAREENFASRESVVKDQAGQYTFPNELSQSQWALRGLWVIKSDKIISAQSGAAIKIHFNAGKVFMVMGSATQQPISVSIILNGERKSSEIIVKDHTLYEVLSFKQSMSGILYVIASAPGLEVYTFTFG